MAKLFIPKPITATLEENYMPYVVSVVKSRAIPEIDGFKPSHRKLLYTMYKMGLLSGAKTKSANIVGQTMRLNPHGDMAIYETMVRLTRGHDALLHPFVDSKAIWRLPLPGIPRRSWTRSVRKFLPISIKKWWILSIITTVP